MNTVRHNTRKHRTNRRRWPTGMRMKLVARDAMIDRMERKEFSNRRLAKYAECAPGTIDNLVNGRTESVQKPRTAELICEALDVPLDVFFVPAISSDTKRIASRRKVAA